jgi:GTP:adenosylcobinamide-phosphate guanylyltransferase
VRKLTSAIGSMKNTSDQQRFTSLVLAADRQPDDPVAALGGAGCKALTPVNGVPMLHRVVKALQTSAYIDGITLVGPGRVLLDRDPLVCEWLKTRQVDCLEPAATPSASTLRGLEHNPARPVFLTTADHALLRSEMIDYFLEQSLSSGCDFTVAVTPLDTVLSMFPGTRRTAIKLQGGPYCGSNMFAFLTPQSDKIARFWQAIENERKKPRKVISGALGVIASIKYLLGRLSLEQAMQRMSSEVGIKIGAVVMPFAEAAVDVDSAKDFQLVESVLAQRQVTLATWDAMKRDVGAAGSTERRPCS